MRWFKTALQIGQEVFIKRDNRWSLVKVYDIAEDGVLVETWQGEVLVVPRKDIKEKPSTQLPTWVHQKQEISV